MTLHLYCYNACDQITVKYVYIQFNVLHRDISVQVYIVLGPHSAWLPPSSPFFPTPFALFPLPNISSFVSRLFLSILQYTRDNIHLCFHLFIPLYVSQFHPVPPQRVHSSLQPDSILLSSWRLPAAVCTHVDSPFHVGPSTQLWDLDIYMNPAWLFII